MKKKIQKMSPVSISNGFNPYDTILAPRISKISIHRSKIQTKWRKKLPKIQGGQKNGLS